MSKYLCIENPGVVPVEAFTMFGVSTARGKADKIGQFGSGAKQAINMCLRELLNPIVISDNTYITFDCKKKDMQGVEYNQVIAVINGQARELSWATEFGAIDWNRFEMALRELYSNALDQGGLNAFVTDNVEHKPGATRVYLEYVPVVEAAHKAMPDYFLHLAEKSDQKVIEKPSLSPIKLYRKGVLVYTGKPNQLSIFDYNLPDISLNESRNLHEYMVPSYISRGFGTDTRALTRIIAAILDNENVVEVTQATPTWIDQDLFKEIWNERYAGMSICLPDMINYVLNKQKAIPVNKLWYDRFIALGVKEAQYFGGSKRAAKEGMSIKEPTKDIINRVKRTWKKLENMGMTNGKAMPYVKEFTQPMNCGTMLNGYCEDDTVYFNTLSCSNATVIEELAHYITGADDCTRDFQDWAFNVAALMMFK